MTRLLAAFAAVALAGAGASAGARASSARPSPRELALDRYNADQAAAIVIADERYYVSVSPRLHELETSWQREVAANHPRRAGFAAQEHFKALQVEQDARWKLMRARMDLTAAREKLILDEYQAQHATYASR